MTFNHDAKIRAFGIINKRKHAFQHKKPVLLTYIKQRDPKDRFRTRKLHVIFKYPYIQKFRHIPAFVQTAPHGGRDAFVRLTTDKQGGKEREMPQK